MTTTLDDAQALVERWSEDMGHPWSGIGLQRVTFTDQVKERLAADIVALVDAALAHERCLHPPTIRFKDRELGG